MDSTATEAIYTLDQLPGTAAAFIHRFKETRSFAFQGDLGAGKTTFIAACCRALGVTDAVSSPTFALINEYHSPQGPVYHLDLYRLSGAEEATRAGLEDCLYSGATSFVEWPERAPEILPPGTVHVLLETLDERTRRWSVTLS